MSRRACVRHRRDVAENRDLKVEKQGQFKAKATVTVRNTGDLAGAEVAQLYINHPKSVVEKADVELVGFVKVHLQPGDSKTVTIPVDVSSSSVQSRGTRADTTAQGILVL